MKMFKLAFAVCSLTCLQAKADVQANLSPVIDHVGRVAIGAAAGYVAKKQLALYARNSAESKTLGKVGYFVPTAAVTAAALAAAYYALGGKQDTVCFYVGSLAAVTTFVATQNADEEDDVYQAYAAANEEKKK